jgi:hypothetical protein
VFRCRVIRILDPSCFADSGRRIEPDYSPSI